MAAAGALRRLERRQSTLVHLRDVLQRRKLLALSRQHLIGRTRAKLRLQDFDALAQLRVRFLQIHTRSLIYDFKEYRDVHKSHKCHMT